MAAGYWLFGGKYFSEKRAYLDALEAQSQVLKVGKAVCENKPLFCWVLGIRPFRQPLGSVLKFTNESLLYFRMI